MRNINLYLNKILREWGYGGRIRLHPLQGDGSDRLIFRVYLGLKSNILVHYYGGTIGIPSENDSFFLIGSHLKAKGLPTPEIFDYQQKAGFFLMEDFGDLSLAHSVFNKKNNMISGEYKKLINLLIKIQTEGAEGFCEDWCYDTPVYDGNFSRERETDYFVREFVRGLLGRTINEGMYSELEEIAGRVDAEKIRLFLYRDFQSRNVMVRKDGFGLIDFQAGRLGPPQYDLASLLIDPYVGLEPVLQDEIRDYYMQILGEKIPLALSDFLVNYHIIGFQRNLQILGAFSFLSRVKGKKYFEKYIPAGVLNLKRWITFPTFRPYRHFRRFLGEI
jgi:N-acetylmuramate 1-kinase